MKLARNNSGQIYPSELYFGLPGLVQFLIWFCFILFVKHDQLAAAPVWDTAMGIFPPAIFLAENNFDLLKLIQQPNWFEAGPNVHSFSLWTWLTAIAIKLLENPAQVFTFLHLMTFVLSAWAISTYIKLLKTLNIIPSVAILSGFLLSVIPLVLVQIGYMYVELPILALSILATARWSEGKEGFAVGLSILAISIKLTGAAIALTLFTLLVARSIVSFNLRRLCYLVAIPLAILISANLPSILGGIARDASPSWEYGSGVWYQLWARLLASPDISVLVLSGVLCALFFTIFRWRKLDFAPSLHNLINDVDKNSTTYLVVVFPLIFLFGILAMTLADKMFLQRYWVPMLPFTIAQIGLLFSLIKKENLVLFVFSAYSIFAVMNHHGRFYPSARAFSVLETTHAYQNYILDLQMIIDRVMTLDDTTPIYVSREIFYMMSHPSVGYVNYRKKNLIPINQSRYKSLSLDQLQNPFYTVITDRYHGGQRLRSTIREARSRPDWQVRRIYRQAIDDRKLYIHRVEKAGTLN